MNWYQRHTQAQVRYKDFLDSNKGEMWEYIKSLAQISGITESQLECLWQIKKGDEKAVMKKLEEYVKQELEKMRSNRTQENEKKEAMT